MILNVNCHWCRGEGKIAAKYGVVQCQRCQGRGYLFLIKDANWTSYCIEIGDIKQKHIDTLDKVKEIVKCLLPGASIMPNCHWVCMMIVKLYPQLNLEWYKGKFAEVNEHSWLVFKDSPNTIIDAYPVACASGPILLTLEGTIVNPWYRLYKGEPDNA
jgi:hypothetical protein